MVQTVIEYTDTFNNSTDLTEKAVRKGKGWKEKAGHPKVKYL